MRYVVEKKFGKSNSQEPVRSWKNDYNADVAVLQRADKCF